MAKIIAGHNTFTVVVSAEEFITSTIHVPPNAMSGGEVIRTFIEHKLASTKYGKIINSFKGVGIQAMVTERFLDGNFIVTWEKG